MRSYESGAEIAASPDAIWAILVDGPRYFHMREEYTGPMLPLIWRSMPDLQPSFDEFAAGLKRRAEAGS